MNLRERLVKIMTDEYDDLEQDPLTWKDGVLLAGMTLLAVGVYLATKDVEKYPEERR